MHRVVEAVRPWFATLLIVATWGGTAAGLMSLVATMPAAWTQTILWATAMIIAVLVSGIPALIVTVLLTPLFPATQKHEKAQEDAKI